MPNSIVQGLTTTTPTGLNRLAAFPMVTLFGLLAHVSAKDPRKEVRLRLRDILEIIRVGKSVTDAVDRTWTTRDGEERRRRYPPPAIQPEAPGAGPRRPPRPARPIRRHPPAGRGGEAEGQGADRPPARQLRLRLRDRRPVGRRGRPAAGLGEGEHRLGRPSGLASLPAHAPRGAVRASDRDSLPHQRGAGQRARQPTRGPSASRSSPSGSSTSSASS